ncbi:efflux RND transporter periplasmic adaptor subunit [Ruminococcus sp. 5_1_39BFAA]|uniref:efflux RND transporter periplasmic adaptor subunit n=1 Tax=Ruminococcus sp. 5_1_39BFAA TaxID=457412 RepID=UPI0035624F5F
MKKKIFVIGGIVIIAGAVGAGAWYYLKDKDGGAAGDEVAYVTKISTLSGDDSGVMNRFAGVVEPQETVKVSIESGRKVKEVQVKTGEEVKAGQLLFEYDLTSIQEDLQEAKLALDRLKNEALSLNDQIKTLEKEKKKASNSNQLSYTIEIETNKMNLKKNEYDQISKEAEITKLENATGNTEVRSEIDGVIQKIDTTKLTTDDGDSLDESMDSYSGDSDSNDSNTFITILSTGAYRIKGKVNEQNKSSITPGEPVIIRSRVDETEVWHGTMGAIDEQNASSESSSNMYYGMIDSSGDSQTSSSSYPFYVELESSEGLMLGQHVYIEKDEGQEEKKEGVWLSDFYIVDADSDNPYVWAANDKDRLEKREVMLGQYDETLGEYEIADGLTEDDSIAFPAENLVEGMATADGSMMTDLGLGSTDMGTDMYDGSDVDMIEDYGTAGEAVMEDYSDGDAMMPIEDMDGEFTEEYVDDSMDGEIIDEDGFDDYMEGADLYDSDDMEAAG